MPWQRSLPRTWESRSKERERGGGEERKKDGTEVEDEDMEAGERTQLGENEKMKCQIPGTVQKCQGEEGEKSVIPQCQGDNFLNSGHSSSLKQ